MLKTVEATGKTTNDAVAAALRSLMEINPDITEADVDVELLERARSGFLGIGSSNAKVRVTYEMKPLESAKIFLSGLLEHIGVNGFVDGVVTEEGTIALNVTGENMGVVIGCRGDTLDALQYLTSLYVNKGSEDYIRVTLDTENYRAKREEALRRLANRMANRAVKTGRKVVMEPMNPYERRILHSALQQNDAVTTHSEGEEPNRHVVITLKQQN